MVARKLGLLALLALCALALSACSGDFVVTVNPDASGQIWMSYTVDDGTPPPDPDALDERRSAGYEVILNEGEGSWTLALEKVFTRMTAASINEVLETELIGEAPAFQTVRTPEGLYVRLDGEYDLTDQPLGDGFTGTLVLPVPVKTTNADVVSEDGCTLSWNLRPERMRFLAETYRPEELAAQSPAPTAGPDEPADEPIAEPIAEPTAAPDEPIAEPTNEPTVEPTNEPTNEPTDEPAVKPTPEPRAALETHFSVLVGDVAFAGGAAGAPDVDASLAPARVYETLPGEVWVHAGDGEAVVSIGRKYYMLLANNSLAHIACAPDGGVKLTLARGTLLLDALDLPEAEHIALDAPQGTFALNAGAYALEADEGHLQALVLKGGCAFTPEGGEAARGGDQQYFDMATGGVPEFEDFDARALYYEVFERPNALLALTGRDLGALAFGPRGDTIVWYTKGGKYYHAVSDCGTMKRAEKHTYDEALAAGKGRCPYCHDQ